MTRTLRGLSRWIALCCVGTSTLSAQPPSAQDAEIARARALVEAGQGTTARALLDSLVAASPAGSRALGDALYWRGLLAADAERAERDWQRVVIEAPLSAYTEDALLRLAQLAILRGAPADADPYLDRALQQYIGGASQARGHYWRAQRWFAVGDAPRACGALAVVQRIAPRDATELRAQADGMQPRCRGVSLVTDASSATPPARPAPSASPSSTARPPGARFSVQLAAYNTRSQAEALVRRLAARGIEARVDGTEKPFRVRTGYYETSAAAAARLAEFKRQGMDGFVAELTP